MIPIESLEEKLRKGDCDELKPILQNGIKERIFREAIKNVYFTESTESGYDIKQLLHIVVKIQSPQLIELILDKADEEVIDETTLLLAVEYNNHLELILNKLSDDKKSLIKDTISSIVEKEMSADDQLILLFKYVTWEHFKLIIRKQRNNKEIAAWSLLVARSGNNSLMNNWLQSDVPPDLTITTKANKSNVLHEACSSGSDEMVELLLKKMEKEQIISLNSEGKTPLLNASKSGIGHFTLHQLFRSYNSNIKKFKKLVEDKNISLYNDNKKLFEMSGKNSEISIWVSNHRSKSSSPDVCQEIKKSESDPCMTADTTSHNIPYDSKPTALVSSCFDQNEPDCKLFEWKKLNGRDRYQSFINTLLLATVRLWNKINSYEPKAHEDINSYKEAYPNEGTNPANLAALFGSTPEDALEMFLAVWCYTTASFYEASGIRRTMTNIAAGDASEEDQRRSRFLHPVIYHLRQLLLRLPREDGVRRRGDKAAKSEKYNAERSISFPYFVSTSSSVDIVMNTFMEGSYRDACYVIVIGCGADVAHFSSNEKTEKEVLFCPDFKFTVLKKWNSSLLRHFGCTHDVVVIVQDTPRERKEEMEHIRIALSDMMQFLFYNFKSRYVEPRLCKNLKEISLDDLIKGLQNEKDIQPVVIQSDAGEGKTAAVIAIANRLFTKGYFCLFVSMAAIENAFDKHVIDDYINEKCLTDKCTAEHLVKQYKLVVILDSLDEGTAIPESSEMLTLRQLNPDYLGNSKTQIIITCRTEYLSQRHLTPKSLLGDNAVSYRLLPFNDDQKDEFEKKMVREAIKLEDPSPDTILNHDPCKAVKETVNSLRRRGLWNVLCNPQVLYMAIKAGTTYNNTSDIYENYINYYVGSQLDEAERDAKRKEESKSDVLKKEVSKNEKEIAEDKEIARRKDVSRIKNSMIHLAIRMLKMNRWEGALSNYFKDEDNLREVVKSDLKYSPVFYEEDVVRFQHKTLPEYLVASYIAGSSPVTDGIANLPLLKEVLSVRPFAITDIGILSQHRLLLQNLNSGTHSKLSEATLKSTLFLMNLVTEAKKKTSNAMLSAASNAFSLLASSGETFFNQDLSFLTLKEASLADCCLVQTNFKNVKFEKCDFRRCQLIECNLTGSEVLQPIFDMTLPPITVGTKARSIFTRNGDFIIVSTGDVKLYSTTSGAVINVATPFKTEYSEVTNIACSNTDDNKDIVIAACSNATQDKASAVVFWMPFSKEVNPKLKPIIYGKGDYRFCEVSFSPDNSHLAVAAERGDTPCLLVWEVEGEAHGKKILTEFAREATGNYPSVRYTSSKTSLLVCVLGDEIIIRKYDNKQGHYTSVFSPINNNPLLIAVPPCGGGSDVCFASLHKNEEGHYKVHIWDGDCINTHIFEGSCGGLALSDCGSYVACGGDKEITIRNFEGNIVENFKGHTCEVRSVNYSSKGHLTTAGHSLDDDTVGLWSTSGLSRHLQEGHTERVTHISICSQFLASSDEDGLVIIWNHETGAQLRSLRPHKNITSVNLTEDYLVTSSAEELKYFDRNTWEPRSRKMSIKCTAVQIIGDQTLIVIAFGTTIQVVKIEPKEGFEDLYTNTVEEAIVDIACSDTYIALATEKIILLNWKYEISDCELAVQAGIKTKPLMITFTHGGSYLLIQGKCISKWEKDHQEWKKVGEFRGNSRVRPVLVPQGNSVISTKGKCIHEENTEVSFCAHFKLINAIAASPDGNVLMSASDNIRVWRRNDDGKWEMKRNLGEIARFQVLGTVKGMAQTPAKAMFEASIM